MSVVICLSRLASHVVSDSKWKLFRSTLGYTMGRLSYREMGRETRDESSVSGVPLCCLTSLFKRQGYRQPGHAHLRALGDAHWDSMRPLRAPAARLRTPCNSQSCCSQQGLRALRRGASHLVYILWALVCRYALSWSHVLMRAGALVENRPVSFPATRLAARHECAGLRAAPFPLLARTRVG